MVLSEPAQGEAADEAAGAVEDASHTKEDDDEHDDDRGESGGPAACEDDGADGDASPVGDRDGSQESGASDDEFAYLEELVTHAREFLMDDDSLAAGSSKRRLDFADNDDGCDIKKDRYVHACIYVISCFPWSVSVACRRRRRTGPSLSHPPSEHLACLLQILTKFRRLLWRV